ncbi:S8 family serine peptidase [Oceanobacillus luteolus]|uniref:S8 family serine peptidase n=1 Tax=Oceanobacillus luteolus TaxID=1274358 RepID=A0ABW4HU91_9BACI
MTEKQIKLIPFTVESTEYQPNEIPRGVSMVNAPEIWEDNAGDDVVIAVIDTGVDAHHPELSGNIIGGYNFTIAVKDKYTIDTKELTSRICKKVERIFFNNIVHS